jgi:hypothetical protein
MFFMKPRRVLQMTISLAALSVLGACGGGDSSPAQTVADSPQVPPATPTPPPPPPPPPSTEIKLAAAYTDIHDAQGLSQPYWAAWGYTGTAPIDGVSCATTATYHIHAMVSIYRDGVRLALPGNIGRSSCNYDMHTHDGSGVVHIETATPKAFTLGQFFSLWGQTLSPTEVAGLAGAPTFYVIQNEQIKPYTGNPDDLTLEAHKEILIITGTPPTEVPRYNWGTSGL